MELSGDEVKEIERLAPSVNLEKCLVYFLARFAKGDKYPDAIRALYKAVIFGRIGRDVRKEMLMEEFTLHVEKAYDSMHFRDDCPEGTLIEP